MSKFNLITWLGSCSMAPRSIKKLFFLFVFIPCLLNAVERKQLFDSNWRFHLGPANYAEAYAYNDTKWRMVDLPHDWSIEPLENQVEDRTIGPFSKDSPGGAATGQTLGGEGWYRKIFSIPIKDTGKRHELYFEGIYNQSEIWINGKKAYENVYGYSTFRFDISPYCNPAGKPNVIAVKVLNRGKNSRWYTGSGIYRHVWLITTAKTYIDDWATSIQTQAISNKQAEISIGAGIISKIKTNEDLKIKVAIISPSGKTIHQAESLLTKKSSDTINISFQFMVNNPQLWNIETPSRYQLRLTLLSRGEVYDEVKIPFGIRTIAYSIEKGFQINGNTLKLKGGCVHHDNGLLGAAAFDRAEVKKIEMLKQNGFNAVRGSHNPMSESFMNACDSLGMLVIDEAFDQWEQAKNPDDYHLYFKEWSARDIRSLVLRDRNRPSVIMWSIGNEIKERISKRGKEIAAFLKTEILKYDTTRAVTAGVNKYWDKDRKNMLPLDNAFYHLDIAGYNYMWRFYEQEHEKFPNRIIFGSESVATEAADNWRKVETLPYVIGDFVWTAMDYLGESGIGNSSEVAPQENVHQFMDWPWYNGWCGDIDLLGIKKPQSYYRDIIWKEKKISMAVERPIADGKIRKVSFWGWPEEIMAWNFPGKLGQVLTVNVYSRAPKIKLYLNGKMLSEEKTSENYKASFKVPYGPGELKAVEDFNGIIGSTTTLATPGNERMIKLTADRETIRADGQALSYVLIELTDEKGQVILESDRTANISIDGDATKIIASGNGSPNDMESFGSLQPKLFNGRAMIILRSGYKKGQTTIKVSSEGLKTQNIRIDSR